VTGTLLAGVLVGQLGVTLPNEVKQCFFLLFLFAIGFRTGPQFFRGLKSDGLAHAALAAIVATTGLLVAWLVAGLFGYDAGTAAGLVAGSLTESATIGTAMDAIGRLDLSEIERTALNNNIPVAFAVTYLVGVIGAAWILSQLAPKLLRVDLAEECRKLEEQMQGGAAGPATARRDVELRAYAVDPGHVSSVAAWPTWRRPRAARASSSSSCAAAARSSRAVTQRYSRKVTWWRCPGRARRSSRSWKRPAAACARWTIANCSNCRRKSSTSW